MERWEIRSDIELWKRDEENCFHLICWKIHYNIFLRDRYLLFTLEILIVRVYIGFSLFFLLHLLELSFYFFLFIISAHKFCLHTRAIHCTTQRIWAPRMCVKLGGVYLFIYMLFIHSVWEHTFSFRYISRKFSPNCW